MNYLKEASGAKVYVTTLPYFRDSQVCHIEGKWNASRFVLYYVAWGHRWARK